MSIYQMNPPKAPDSITSVTVSNNSPFVVEFSGAANPFPIISTATTGFLNEPQAISINTALVKLAENQIIKQAIEFDDKYPVKMSSIGFFGYVKWDILIPETHTPIISVCAADTNNLNRLYITEIYNTIVKLNKWVVVNPISTSGNIPANNGITITSEQMTIEYNRTGAFESLKSISFGDVIRTCDFDYSKNPFYTSKEIVTQFDSDSTDTYPGYVPDEPDPPDEKDSCRIVFQSGDNVAKKHYVEYKSLAVADGGCGSYGEQSTPDET